MTRVALLVAADQRRQDDLALLEMQRANIFMWQGQSDQALAGYAAALHVFRRTND